MIEKFAVFYQQLDGEDQTKHEFLTDGYQDLVTVNSSSFIQSSDGKAAINYSKGLGSWKLFNKKITYLAAAHKSSASLLGSEATETIKNRKKRKASFGHRQRNFLEFCSDLPVVFPKVYDHVKLRAP